MLKSKNKKTTLVKKKKRASSFKSSARRLDFTLSPTSRSGLSTEKKEQLGIKRARSAFAKGRVESMTRSLCTTNSDIQDVYDREDCYGDVMNISLDYGASGRKRTKGSAKKAPRSPSPTLKPRRDKKNLEKLQKEVKEMRSWESKILE